MGISYLQEWGALGVGTGEELDLAANAGWYLALPSNNKIQKVQPRWECPLKLQELLSTHSISRKIEYSDRESKEM